MLVSQFAVPNWATWAVLTVSTFAVRIGGLQRLTKVASALVPIMVIFYMGGSALVLINHLSDIPGAFVLIFKTAFTGTAATGGFIGAGVAEAIRYGVARGIFSNEAGMGTTSIAHATAKSDDDVRQAALSMVGPFIDTIVLCTVTGLVIVVTGVWETGGTGAPLVARAFESVVPGAGGLIVTGAVLMFGLSVLWGWGLYGERAAVYLFGERALIPSRYVYTITAPLGALLNVDTAWAFIDLSFAMMAAPNLIALILLSPVVFRTTLARLKGGAPLIPRPAPG
jgi:AGCS family alanine or glycine:cation symporter